jgi:8-oxo-dGTP pyrophosphatase MutT (NUDIX family)
MNLCNPKRKIYCCNCGKLGHVLRNCLEPIISLGIILYHNDISDIRFLMIRRKFSLGFMDFILGKYSINNIEYIYRIFNEMTINEKIRIINESFNKLWFSIDYNCYDSDNNYMTDEMRKKFENDYLISKKKFMLIKHGYINKYNQYINLYQVVKNSKYNWLEQEWEFPKGKRKMNESNLDAAIREFREETNFPEDNLDIILTDQPIVEKYFGSNNKKYKHIYYIARANNFFDYSIVDFTEHQNIEISNIRWMSYNEAMKSIRPYQIEKKMALTQVLKFLMTNFLT